MKEKILVMLNMQSQLQSVIDPEWTSRNYPWWRAIYMECAEMIDHIGWKWWKKQEPNVDQVHLELVDIYHFIMNEHIQEMGSSLSCEVLSKHFEYTYRDSTSQLVPFIESMMAHSLVSKCSNPHSFVELCALSGLSFDKLYRLYICKNVLNTFRQNNGYKSGEYIKNWALASNTDLEDNVFLSSLRLDWDDPQIPVTINQLLSNRYRLVLEFNNNEAG